MTPKKIRKHYTVVASVSGGKDSTAMCLHLREMDIPYIAVFADTGWENAETYRYITEELPGYIGPVTTVRADIPVPEDARAMVDKYEARLGRQSDMIRRILRWATFPSRQARWCTRDLKVTPIKRLINEQDADVINAVGVRATESAARAKLPQWEESKELRCDVWRPLLHWTEEDVIAIHQRHDVVPNRGYFDGAERVGCWPCIYSRKSEIRRMADIDPDRVALIRDLESDVMALLRARDKEPESPPALFQQTLGRSGACMPIDGVVAWSRTARGGRRFELFDTPERERGCMRWGMCEWAKPE